MTLPQAQIQFNLLIDLVANWYMDSDMVFAELVFQRYLLSSPAHGIGMLILIVELGYNYLTWVWETNVVKEDDHWK